jgi:inosine-uridine nucleoside N-ribohydrolase
MSLEEIQSMKALKLVRQIASPQSVIWDTDWCGDVDDAVAARILMWAERHNMVDIVACVISSYYDNAVPSLDAFLDFEGHPKMTIGIDKGATSYTQTPIFGQANMIANNRHTYVDSASAEAAITTYRRALATSKDKINIICTGFLTVISSLLQSNGDSISPLTGLQLVSQKVNKIYIMGGQYPSGSEFNFNHTTETRYAANYVCANSPVPLFFCGFEVGNTIISGDTLTGIYAAADDILSKALTDAARTTGRNSWDPITMYLAVHGDAERAGFSIIQGTNSVDVTTGANTFTANSTGKHYYVTKIRTDNFYKSRLNTILEKRAWVTRNNIGVKQLPKP